MKNIFKSILALACCGAIFASCEQEVPENAVCSAEPGIYLAGKFGVRIEDCIIFKADGYENLATSPKELIIV